MNDFTKLPVVKCAPWLVLPTVYGDELSYGEQLNKFCANLNALNKNNNMLPEYISNLIQEYITSGAIEENIRNVLSTYILNVKYPPEGITPAKGDGSADDTEAIQGCIDYCYNHYASKGIGSCIYFPFGSYLTTNLNNVFYTTLFGFDKNSTQLVIKGGSNTGSAINLYQGSGILNLTLIGNAGSQVKKVGALQIAINNVDGVYTNNVYVSNCNFIDFNHSAIYLLGGYTSDNNVIAEINGNLFKDIALEVLTTKRNATLTFKNNTLYNCGSATSGLLNIETSGGNYDFTVYSGIKYNYCGKISGDNNTFNITGGNYIETLKDSGQNNSFLNLNSDSNIKGSSFSFNTPIFSVDSDTSLVLTSRGDNLSLNGVGCDVNIKTSGSTPSNVNINSTNNLIENVTNIKRETVNGNKTVFVNGTNTEHYADNTETTQGNKSVTVTLATTYTYNDKVTTTIKGKDDKTIYSDASKHIEGVYTKAVDGAATESFDSTYSKLVTGVATETYNGGRTITDKVVVENAEKKTINATDIVLNPTTALTYKKPSANYTQFFDSVPMKDTDGNVYQVLVGNANTGNIDTDIPDTGFTGIKSVKDFGVVGDGVTDDTTNLQNAINTCATSKEILYLPAGTYLINTAGQMSGGSSARNYCISLPNHCKIIGYSRDCVKFITNSKNSELFTSNRPEHSVDINLANFTIVGSGSLTGSDDGTGIWIYDAEDVHIDNVKIQDSANWNLRLELVDNFYVNNSVFDGGENTNSDSFHMVDCSRGYINNIECYSKSDDGLVFEANTKDTYDIFVSGAYIRLNNVLDLPARGVAFFASNASRSHKNIVINNLDVASTGFDVQLSTGNFQNIKINGVMYGEAVGLYLQSSGRATGEGLIANCSFNLNKIGGTNPLVMSVQDGIIKDNSIKINAIGQSGYVQLNGNGNDFDLHLNPIANATALGILEGSSNKINFTWRSDATNASAKFTVHSGQQNILNLQQLGTGGGIQISSNDNQINGLVRTAVNITGTGCQNNTFVPGT